MDHVDLVWVYRKEAQHVVARFLRHGDYGIGVFDAGPLHPTAQVVACPKLLDLPWPQRFQRADRQDERHAPQLLCQEAGHIGVPGMAMDDIGVQRILGHCQATGKRVQSTGEAWVCALFKVVPSVVAAHAQIVFLEILVAERSHLDRNQPRELAA